ncbi:hypothetical protein [Azohydromonas lata]|uniref:Uncharacterized protein n=1 Tax=Azohydromonas lata TaxID=45677 RepID=A0ABU5I7V5_9BURK|nr:hypothetical protein [Azohydromonas lata]MDZ5455063.1 hypothetical protein [Azohydromonas lata]
MPKQIDGADRAADIVQTSLWLREHEWLYSVMKSPRNTCPKFRIPDLLAACVTLAFSSDVSQHQLITYLRSELLLRQPEKTRRSCDIWKSQFDLLMTAHRDDWNRFPHPMFNLDQICTGCVAVVMTMGDAQTQVLSQARRNVVARTSSAAIIRN